MKLFLAFALYVCVFVLFSEGKTQPEDELNLLPKKDSIDLNDLQQYLLPVSRFHMIQPSCRRNIIKQRNAVIAAIRDEMPYVNDTDHTMQFAYALLYHLRNTGWLREQLEEAQMPKRRYRIPFLRSFYQQLYKKNIMQLRISVLIAEKFLQTYMEEFYFDYKVLKLEGVEIMGEYQFQKLIKFSEEHLTEKETAWIKRQDQRAKKILGQKYEEQVHRYNEGDGFYDKLFQTKFDLLPDDYVAFNGVV